ncbi:hypothetical protein DSO57_1026531 [Entomophthora muscae]|uniref:Uncharacterized protein n=1 Tax=Entomophthora muscae TaxID=34485 RepID=A0ACC2T1W0_9FUNG|nr:hypothetical protein DSO57_1026531 [Entomophthora muscae]
MPESEKFPLTSGVYFTPGLSLVSPKIFIFTILNACPSSKVCGLYSVYNSSVYLVYFFRPLRADLLLSAPNLPNRAHELLISGEYLVKSLTCDNLDPLLLNPPPGASHREDPLVPALPVKDPQPISWTAPASQSYSTQHTSWLLA